MANLFGAIDVGSHEMELKIFELSKKNGIRQVDDIIHLIDLGTDTYNDGRISFAHVAEVKSIRNQCLPGHGKLDACTAADRAGDGDSCRHFSQLGTALFGLQVYCLKGRRL